ncbi:hypothetical protein EVAR_93378_1 [Eumeta japonica]|uniref:Uncharacterized protein n=1 Tax=Eumeta variegata TaxID=151549 RepID=A0A4C1SDE9_EUMVA|nr:hypothetical protein EVAR_93378_1 [Eumeta japonica]
MTLSDIYTSAAPAFARTMDRALVRSRAYLGSLFRDRRIHIRDDFVREPTAPASEYSRYQLRQSGSTVLNRQNEKCAGLTDEIPLSQNTASPLDFYDIRSMPFERHRRSSVTSTRLSVHLMRGQPILRRSVCARRSKPLFSVDNGSSNHVACPLTLKFPDPVINVGQSDFSADFLVTRFISIKPELLFPCESDIARGQTKDHAYKEYFGQLQHSLFSSRGACAARDGVLSHWGQLLRSSSSVPRWSLA